MREAPGRCRGNGLRPLQRRNTCSVARRLSMRWTDERRSRWSEKYPISCLQAGMNRSYPSTELTGRKQGHRFALWTGIGRSAHCSVRSLEWGGAPAGEVFCPAIEGCRSGLDPGSGRPLRRSRQPSRRPRRVALRATCPKEVSRGKGPGQRASEPHDIVPSIDKTGSGGWIRWTLSHAVGRSSSRARLSRHERSSGGIREPKGGIHVDGSQPRRHESHGLTRRTRVGSNRGGRNG